MAQGRTKPRKNAGSAVTPRRNKSKSSPNGLRNPAIGKVRKIEKLVKIGKIEKQLVATASANHEHLVVVHKFEKKKKVIGDSGKNNNMEYDAEDENDSTEDKNNKASAESDSD